MSIIQVNESGETDHLLNLSKVDNWSVEDVDFLPFQVLQDGRILLGNTSTQVIHIIDLKSEEVESKHANLYFTDFAYFEKEDVFVLYSPMPFSDPNEPNEIGYDIYFLDAEMKVTNFIKPSEITHPFLEIGFDRGFAVPEFTDEYILWMQYTTGKVSKIYPNGEIVPFIQIENNAGNLLAIERIIENEHTRIAGALPVRSLDNNVLKYIPFSDIHF